MILKIWKNKWKILSGIWNSWFPNAYVEKVVAKRKQICKNCELFDLHGESKRCYVPGSPCCTACGCNLNWKQSCLTCECGIKEAFPQQEPLWKAEMSESEYQKFKDRNGYEERQ